MREYSGLTWMGDRGERVTWMPHSRWSTTCPACTAEGKANPAWETSLILWESPKEHGSRTILSFSYACACELTKRTLGLWSCECSWVRIPQEESGRGISYMWLPPAAKLFPGFSLMPGRAGCVRPMLPGREAWISLRIHTDGSRWLQDFYYPLAVTQFSSQGSKCCQNWLLGLWEGQTVAKRE